VVIGDLIFVANAMISIGIHIAILVDAPCPHPKKFWLHEEVIGHPRMLQSAFDHRDI
jgi:hypothetical protein